MSEAVEVGWVRPAEPIRGLDHLGTQAPCVALYAQLLPGITNVTDRARYYSFHPWLLRCFERRFTDRSLDSFRRVLRRAECLFAMIAIRHARALGDTDENRHGAGMVGRLALLRAFNAGGPLSLDDHAAFEGSKRYFLNKLGGLGQYHFGPLRDLLVLDHGPEGTECTSRIRPLAGRRPCRRLRRRRARGHILSGSQHFDSDRGGTRFPCRILPLRVGRKHPRAPTSAGSVPRTVRHVQDTGQRLASVVTRPSA